MARMSATTTKITFADMRAAGALAMCLSVQPLNYDQRRPLARSCPAVGDRTGFRLLMSLYFSGNFLVEVAVPRLELPGPNAVTVI